MIFIKWTSKSFGLIANIEAGLFASIMQVLERVDNTSIVEPGTIQGTIDSCEGNIKEVLQSAIVKLIDTAKIVGKEPVYNDSLVVGLYDHTSEERPGGPGWFSVIERNIIDKGIHEILRIGKTGFSSGKFSSNGEIASFIGNITDIARDRKLIIISRYCSFDCEVITSLGRNYRNIEIWTTDSSRIDKPVLKRKWGRSFNVFEGHSDVIHERAIIIGGCLIILFDDEFNKIRREYDTWTISIYACRETVRQKWQKRTKLRVA